MHFREIFREIVQIPQHEPGINLNGEEFLN